MQVDQSLIRPQLWSGLALLYLACAAHANTLTALRVEARRAYQEPAQQVDPLWSEVGRQAVASIRGRAR